MTLNIIINKIYRYFIYEHERIGYKGKPFKMYKFRTMILNSDELLPEVERTHGRNARGDIINDPRFTRIGKFFKKYRIDELPQLINILKGEMAIMGPRPHSEFFYERYIPEDLHKRRQTVKPGLLKPRRAYADFDYGGLEFVAERNYLDELEKKQGSTNLRYALRALLPYAFKWQLIPGGRRFKHSDFYEDKQY